MSDAAPRFDGRVVLITGGASGLGLAAAHRLAGEGAHVVLLDLPGPHLADAVASLALPARSAAIPVDVTDAAALDAAVAQAAATHGRIDGLVTSAGVSRIGSVLDTTPAEWAQVLAVNLTGTFNATRAAARHMAERRAGRIVMLASITGMRVWTARAAYAASKGGVIAFMKSCAVDLAAHGITVNSVSPGPIATPQTADLHGPTIRHAVEAAVPLGRYGDAEEVAAAIAFLLSDDARFVSGHDLVVDGALTAAAIRYDRAHADAEIRR